MSNWLNDLAAATKGTAEQAAAKAKETYYQHFGEGLGDYIGGRLTKMGHVAAEQAKEVGISIVASTGMSIGVAKAPAAAKAAGEALKEGAELGKETVEAGEIGAEIGEAAVHGTAGAYAEAIGTTLPKAMALSTNLGVKAASIGVAPVAAITTDEAGRDDIKRGWDNLKEDGAKVGVRLVDTMVSASSILPDSICPENLKRMRQAKELDSQTLSQTQQPSAPKPS